MLEISQKLSLIAEKTGHLIAWATLLMVLISFSIVLLRYGFDLGWIAMQESVTYLHALVFMLGAAYTLKHNGHVRVDIFYQKFGPKGQAWVDLLGSLFLLMPVCVFIFWASWEYVADSWAVQEGSPDAGGLPGIYLLKSLLLIMPVLLLLQGIVQCLESISVIKHPPQKNTPPNDRPGETA